MKISLTINDGSIISTFDLYPDLNVMWIKINGQSTRRELSQEEVLELSDFMLTNPINNFIELAISKIRRLNHESSSKT